MASKQSAAAKSTRTKSLRECRTCRSGNIHVFLRLGDHPIANAFLSKAQLREPELLFPLDVVVCLDCGLIQVADQVPSGFFAHYLYVPSASAAMVKHFAALAKYLTRRFKLTGDHLVVDVGSNNGTFLRNFQAPGPRTLGVEPAANLAKMARQQGVETLRGYFGAATARRILTTHGPATLLTTTNTFNHIDDLHGFMEGVVTLLAADGTFLVEVPHAGDLIRDNEFDTVYHEHLSQFTVRSIAALLDAFGMELFDMERLWVHGGSMRLYGRRKGRRVRSKRVQAWLDAEKRAKLFQLATYERFAARVGRNKEKLWSILHRLKSRGARIAGYGAPAKGNTLLNYYGIGPDTLEYLVDRNPLKQGLYSPGMHIPICPVEKLLEDQPDYVLLLAWNFADEIARQQGAYRRNGGRFILPIPTPRILR